MKKKIILALIILGLLLTASVPSLAQTATPTPTTATATTTPTPTTATTSGTLTPTKTSSLPKTGIVEMSLIFLAVGAGIIVFAFIF